MPISFTQLDSMATRGITNEGITREEALAVLAASDAETMGIVMAGSRVRRHYFDNRIKVNYLINLKSGKCPEDCSYCSQSVDSKAEILKYSWLSAEEAVKQAAAGIGGGAQRVCLVASGRGPTDRDIDRVSKMVEGIKAQNPDVKVCTCLGLLKDGQADKLLAAGSDTYNHNLNTSPERYAEICTTHTYEDRQDTVEKAKSAGMMSCSGMIVGMGESDEEIVDLALALRRIGADSIPVNFLLTFDGTRMGGRQTGLTPHRCLRILSMLRLTNPNAEIRAAAGREEYLRSMQPLALEVCNSIFLGDYLTSEGAAGRSDLIMIHDAGFVLEGANGEAVPIDIDALAPHLQATGPVEAGGCGDAGSGCGGCSSAGSCGDQEAFEAAASESAGCGGCAPAATPMDLDFVTAPVVNSSPKPRRRGAGTSEPANA